MKTTTWHIITVFLLVSSEIAVNAVAITDQTVTTSDAKNVLFRVYDQNYLNLGNHHRTPKQPQLKLSLHHEGVTIDKIELKNVGTFWTLFVSDHSSIDLTVSEVDNATSYFMLIWHGNDHAGREICFHLDYNQAVWFGAYNSRESNWPMNISKSVPKIAFNYLLTDEWSESHGEFKSIVEHLFVNSDGFAILLDQNLPLFLRRDKNVLCFSLNNTYPYHEKSTLDLKIHLFSSANIRTVLDHAVHRSNLIPRPLQLPGEKMFQEPSWWEFSSGKITHDGVMDFEQELERHQMPKGEIILSQLIDAFLHIYWPTEEYDFVDQFFHARGFRLGAMFDPTVSKHWFGSKDSSLVPESGYFIKFPHDNYPSYLDTTNPDTVHWLDSALGALSNQSHVDSMTAHGFYLPANTIVRLNSSEAERNANLLITRFVESLTRYSNSCTTFQAYKAQNLPVFVQLWNVDGPDSMEGFFRTTLANVLSLSIGGYSFVTPTPIGAPSPAGGALTEEMYIRWVQLSTFLPHMSFYSPPWRYNQSCVNLTKKYTTLHSEHAPTFIALARLRATTGSPIIRPMWYSSPDDIATYLLDDQFMVGDDILVAPVFKEGTVERLVYLPSGGWIDQHGKLFTGPGQVKIAAPLQELPYFKRKI